MFNFVLLFADQSCPIKSIHKWKAEERKEKKHTTEHHWLNSFLCFHFQLYFPFRIQTIRMSAKKRSMKKYDKTIPIVQCVSSQWKPAAKIFIFWCSCGLSAYTLEIYYGIYIWTIPRDTLARSLALLFDAWWKRPRADMSVCQNLLVSSEVNRTTKTNEKRELQARN